jgi:hypothetical protein
VKSVRVLALAVGALLLAGLVGCASEPQGENADPDLIDSTALPLLHACRVLKPADVQQSANATEIVDCNERHTAETYRVVELPEEFDDVDYDDSALAGHAYAECSTAFAEFIGADESLMLRTTLSWAWFRPSQRAWDNGARWIRCDVVGGAAEAESYQALPKTAKGLLVGRPDDRWLACARGRTFVSAEKLPCSERHDWRAVSTIVLGEPEDPYPGDDVAESRSSAFCDKQVQAWLNYPAEYDFGITWFHQAEWEAGNRRSVCWAKTTD